MTPEQQQLVLDHLHLPRVILNRDLGALRWHRDADALLSAGNLGLVEAAISYQPGRGATFHTFTSRRVRGAILDEVRRTQFGSRSAHDRPMALAKAAARLGPDATDQDLAADLGWTLETLRTARIDNEQTVLVSLQAAFGDRFVDTDRGPAEAVDTAETLRILSAAVAGLRPRLRHVIEERFLNGRQADDIAAELGVTGSRVSQLTREGLDQLRAKLTAASVETAAA